jgi:4-hydroxy 2-oxovalerate aldolase
VEESEYLKSINSSGIQVLEIGFRFFKKNLEFGDYAYSREDKINNIKLNKNIKLAVMINGSDILKCRDIYKYLPLSTKTKVSIIRFACHAEDIFFLLDAFKYTKLLGYSVIVNLMQINLVKKRKLIKILRYLKESVDVFYFADSFGNMNENNTRIVSRIIKNHWNKEFGIHAHDNCGKAFKNTIVAIKEGATWVDSTILGMGRGAGNLKTEELLSFLNKKYYKKNIYEVKLINDVSKKIFKPLKKIYNWGKSSYYYLAAKNNIHPSYIQLLEKDFRYSGRKKIKIINFLKKKNSKIFSPEKLKRLIETETENKGTWNAKNWCFNKNLLIVTESKFVKNNRIKIINFAKKNHCVVISVNINSFFPKKFIDYFITSNEKRILLDFNYYKLLKKKIIIPVSKFKKIIPNFKIDFDHFNYGLNVDKNNFKILDKYCYVPNNLTLSYCLAICFIGKPKNIFLAGFDGYKDQILNDETNRTFFLFKKFTKFNNIYAINKNIYKVKKIKKLIV